MTVTAETTHLFQYLDEVAAEVKAFLASEEGRGGS